MGIKKFLPPAERVQNGRLLMTIGRLHMHCFPLTEPHNLSFSTTIPSSYSADIL